VKETVSDAAREVTVGSSFPFLTSPLSIHTLKPWLRPIAMAKHSEIRIRLCMLYIKVHKGCLMSDE